MPAPAATASSPFDVPSTPLAGSPFDVGGGDRAHGRDSSPWPWRPPIAREPSPGPWRPPSAQAQEVAAWGARLGEAHFGGPPVGPPVASPAAEVHTDSTKYFVITSNSKENVVRSVRHGLWATQRKNERALDDAFRCSPAVVLVFSVNRSDAFQGYAVMRSPIGRPRSRSHDPFNGFGRLFDVEWLKLHDLPYREVQNVRNPLNGDRPVQFSRDGQELTNSVGRRLCAIIDRHIDEPTSFPKPEAREAPPPQRSPLYSLDLGPPSIPPAVGSRSRSRSRGRRRKREKKYRKAPHPLEASFEEQLEFFMGLDYEDYVEWFARFAAFSPGPTPPPGCPAPAAPPPGVLAPPPMHVHGHIPGYPPPAGHFPPHACIPPPALGVVHAPMHLGHSAHFAPPMY